MKMIRKVIDYYAILNYLKNFKMKIIMIMAQ